MQFRKMNPGMWPSEYSSDFKERTLAKWCRDQRTKWRKGKLNTERFELLTKIKFPFTEKTHEGRWMKQYELLKEFYEKKGHYPQPPGLAVWINQQQLRYSKLSKKQRSLLKAINFKSEIKREPNRERQARNWEDRLRKLSTFYKKHNRLPRRIDDQSLHSWLYHVRKHVKKETLPGTRKKLLAATGIDVMKGTFQKGRL